MREILISIRPEWVEKILNGKKTIEIRKTMPKCELPCKVYIYCTKSKPTLQYFYNWQNYKTISEHSTWASGRTINVGDYGNGKVVAEFTLNKVNLLVDVGAGIHYADKNYNLLNPKDLLKKSCLTEEQIYNYVGENRRNNLFFNDGYAWCIDDLKIYDKPKELSEFGVKRAFQSWGYVNGTNH